MLRQWEEFQLSPDTKEITRERISLTLDGKLTFNARAYELMGRPKFATLYFDRANKLIGVRPAGDGGTNAYPFARSSESESRFIRAKKFCNYFQIRLDGAVVFDSYHVEEGMFVLDLRHVRELYRC